MKHIMALDSGTSITKAIVINKQGEIIASSQKEIGHTTPQHGYVEQNPNEIFQSQVFFLIILALCEESAGQKSSQHMVLFGKF